MDSAVSFGDLNSGLQVGINHGPINAEFHLPLNLDDKLPIVYEAAFDSYVDQHENGCLPGTRIGILHEIKEWALSSQGRCIFWVNGMAGTGKSTISRTVAKSFSQEKSLGASFFFKRGEGDRGNAMKLFPTIARQLAKNIPQLIPGVQKAVYDNPGIAAKTMREQFDKLILQPLLSLKLPSPRVQTVVIVIDALDECEADNDMRLILQLLPQLRESHAIRVRIFLTSRPELPIRLGFSKVANHDHNDLILHEIPKQVIEHDISLFLNYRLSEIRAERSLPVNWPGATSLQNLVALSLPLFIFAATICRIFEDPYWHPVDSLTEILAHRNDVSKLDGTYLPVLNRLLNGQSEKQKKQLVQEFQQVIGSIVVLKSPLSVVSLSRFLGLPERLIHLRLNPLHSVLIVPDDATIPIRLFHLSFRDFLLDPETREKSPFWLDEKEVHYKLTMQCLLVCQNLRKNICELPSDGTQRTEIDQKTIDHCLSPELQYACRYWAYHLIECIGIDGVVQNALRFLQRHFLHWAEAMSVLGYAYEVVRIINLLQTAVTDDKNSTMSGFLHDAKRFILKNCQIADSSPLQLYCSGLIFTPPDTIIRKEFGTELPNWIYKCPDVEGEWSTDLQTLEGHSDSTRSVAFSPRDHLIASGSEDKTIRIWDIENGAIQQILEGHSHWVRSVAFSPDGHVLASGSEDETVRLWETATGALQQTLNGHTSTVRSVAFSPDGRFLASGSSDNTIRLWDIETNAPQRTLDGHADSIRSVTFSPDGRLLASGSSDKTIQLWDIAEGALRLIIKGHARSVQSVAFSPNGQQLASCSADKTVRIWNTATGVLQQCLEGHSGSVRSVAFSPDGRLLASGSEDKIVRLWDTATGELQLSLAGHSNPVWDVAFSPNGRLLASGSEDKIVRLWDTSTNDLQRSLKGFPNPVWAVAFSPDGRLLAAGSEDTKVRLWDVVTGIVQQTLAGHLDSVMAVAFSSDSRLLASGSEDKTVRLWDTATGVLRHILRGHLYSVGSVTFSPDGQLLASGSWDNTVWLWDTDTGSLQLTSTVREAAVSLEFSEDGSSLSTRFESLNIQSNIFSRINNTSHSPRTNSETFVRGQWIIFRGKKTLWLPPVYRPTSSAVNGSILALGHTSGRVSFIHFNC